MDQKRNIRWKTRVIIAAAVIVLVPLVLAVTVFWPMPKTLSLVFTFLVLILCTYFAGIWLYRSAAWPLRSLADAMRKMRDGDLETPVGAESETREFTELIEDFEELRARLRESAEGKVDTDKESKELISNISHDLKTPITAIKGYVEGIRDGVADTPEKLEHYIQTIYNKANDMDRLIDELTIYAKIDTNRIPYSFARIRIADYFDDCVEELRIELQEQGIRLNYINYMENDAVVIADAEQIKRVINNIIGNAVKYMDKENKRIEIRLRDVGDFVQVEFEDNGRGIAQRDLARIFDRFYRTDTSRNSRVGGSGIGLSIVRKILEDHEGRVWATSKEGEGTTVCFVLRKYHEPEQ